MERAVKLLMDGHKRHGGVIDKTAVLKAQEDLYFCKQGYDDLAYFLKSPHQNREKRFLGAFVGGLISGTLFGLLNTAKIASLQSSLNDLEKARVNMVHITERIANETSINAQHIVALEKMNLDIAKEVPTFTITYTSTLLYTKSCMIFHVYMIFRWAKTDLQLICHLFYFKFLE